jgi:hypothetical protein
MPPQRAANNFKFLVRRLDYKKVNFCANAARFLSDNIWCVLLRFFFW